jgi:predicted metal-dependent phosphoesterase TrpH
LGKADLHIHTTVSDGKSKPAEIVALAIQHKLETIAITDHDSIGGYSAAVEAASGSTLTVLPGVELTTRFNGRESHLLAYCFDPEDSDFLQVLSDHKRARLERARWIIGRLAKQGLDLDIDEVKAEANGSNIGRPHIASVLTGKGYVATHQEAFIRYLSDQALGEIHSNYHSFQQVVEVIKQAGGVSVVAHPGQMYSEAELNAMVEAGLDGIEVMHPSHNYQLQKRMEDFAERNNLLISGGSDFHGGSRDYQKYFGVIAISSAKVDRIENLSHQRKKLLVN